MYVLMETYIQLPNPLCISHFLLHLSATTSCNTHTHILQRVVLVCSRRQWETNNVRPVPMARSLTLAGLVAGVHLATLDLRVAVRATPFAKHRKN